MSAANEPDALRIDQGGAVLKRLLATTALPIELEMGEFGAAVHAGCLIGITFDDDGVAAFRGGDVYNVRQVIFARRIVVPDLVEPAE